MRRRFSQMNPTLRGFLIIAAVVGVILLFQLYTTLAVVLVLARIAFFLAIAYFVFLMWRERRSEIAEWPPRAIAVFYGSAIVAVADLALYSFRGAHGFQVLAFVGALVGSGFAMFRVWRDQHHYV
jgi:small-conductance mechanosensitive channel